MDYINIGSAPHDEDCAQVGRDEYATRARRECAAYIKQLRRMYPEPDNGYFAIKSFDHDFGRYYEVVAKFDDNDCAAMEWALTAENGADTWDDVARDELGL